MEISFRSRLHGALYSVTPSVWCQIIVRKCGGITLASSVSGTILGMISGYLGGGFDRIFMGVCGCCAAFPGMVIVLVFVGILGQGFFLFA